MRSLSLVMAAFALVACDGKDSPAAPDTAGSRETAWLERQQWSLPDRLNEISGLALTADERLLSVTDEIAVVYELDYTSGRLVKAFAFGEPPVRDDFEGIEVRDGIVWLMTSDGKLLAGREGANGESVDFEQFEMGLRDVCELEGLSKDATGKSLVLLCKEERGDKSLQMFYWNPDSGEKSRIDLPEKDIESAVGRKDVNPSGIAVSTDNGNFIAVAARQRVVFELAADGRFVDVIMRLERKRHRQAEGIAMTADGRLLIADEADKGSATLTVYRMSHGE